MKKSVDLKRLQELIKTAVLSQDKVFLENMLKISAQQERHYHYMALRTATDNSLNDIAAWLIENYNYNSSKKMSGTILHLARKGNEELLLVCLKHKTTQLIRYESEINSVINATVKNGMEEAIFQMFKMKKFRKVLEKNTTWQIKKYLCQNNDELFAKFTRAKMRYESGRTQI